MVRYLLEHCGFDMVYLVVSPQNPFKDSSLADSSEERLERVKQAVVRNALSDKVKVDDIEFSMPYPSYSIRTLDALAAREKNNRFTLVVGGDNLRELLRWKEGERILTQYGVVVYPREGFNIVHDCAVLKRQHKNAEMLFDNGTHKPYHIKLLRDAPLVNVSSTQIRQMIANGEDVTHLLA